MNDAFAWDVGDLAKFALLRHLAGPRDGDDRRRLGSVWCYTRKPLAHGTDITRRYLREGDSYGQTIRERDPELYELMQRGFRSGRMVSSAEYRSLLPDDAAHVFDRFDVSSTARPAYWESALAVTADASLVFFDPDDGIGDVETTSGRGATRRVSYGEVEPFYRRGQSLVLYQHQNREKGGIASLAARHARALRERLGAEGVFVLSWHRVQARLFVVVPAPDRYGALEARIHGFLASPWGKGDGRQGADFRDALAPLARRVREESAVGGPESRRCAGRAKVAAHIRPPRSFTLAFARAHVD